MAVGQTWGRGTTGLRAALALAVGCFLIWAPTALAAPPNDDFANAQVVGPLPVGLTESNVEATKEEGEPYDGPLGSKGHSVWFKWEATSTGYVTVGTCGSDFAAVAGVYTGTQVNALIKVVHDFENEGPGCPAFNGRQYTFKAISGTTYEIAVDGDAFYVPPGEPPVGEGTFDFQIEATPTPVNDDFVDATALTGSIEENEGAEFAFYHSGSGGFNWNATKQEGEPDHAEDPGGASVWYTWTAPASGTAHVQGCGNVWLLLGVYTGASLDSLAPVGAAPLGAERSHCPNVVLAATAGTTYYFAVDGEFNPGTSEPARGGFTASVWMRLPLRPPATESPPKSSLPPPPAPEATLPETTVHEHVLKRRPPIFIFDFAATEPGSTFRCKLDGYPLDACSSPQTYKHLKPGSHTFTVAAVDPAGNEDSTPAVARFKVPERPQHRRKHRRARASTHRKVAQRLRSNLSLLRH